MAQSQALLDGLLTGGSGCADQKELYRRSRS